MKRLLLAIALFLSLNSFRAFSQIISTGADPSWARWNSIYSDNYRLIYPKELDSLSRIYAEALEKWRIPVSRSSGFIPGEGYSSRMPVVLHPWTASANGMVVWIPRSMSLYTVREAYNPDLLPWEQLLAVHEGRHVAQRQASKSRAHAILGDMAEGLTTGLSLNMALIEGDAVTAETALTEFGRGRHGDFLDYTRMAVLSGDMRDWYQWRWGSQRKYSQNHYALGYMTVAGMRTFYDDPLFMNRYLRSTRSILVPGHFQKTVRQASGRSFRNTWQDLMKSWKAVWEEEDAIRGPFTRGVDAAPGNRLFFSYSKTFRQWSVLSGLQKSPTLVRVGPDGSIASVRPFPSEASKLAGDGKRLYWSEAVPVPRWDLAADSRIRYIEPEVSGGKIHDLTVGGRYYNPAPDGNGNVYAVEYPVEGGSFLVLLSPEGTVLERTEAPGDVQLVEPAVAGQGRVFVTGISGKGAGIYELKDGVLTGRLSPVPYKIHQFRGHEDGRVIFTSDKDGVNQIFSWSAAEGTLSRLTNERFGASNPWLSPGDTLFYSALTPEGRILRKMPVGSGSVEVSDPYSRHIYHVAETISAQERALASGEQPRPEISEPKNYSKAGHLIHIHSWAPFYFNYDNVSSMTGDEYYELAALGATVLFQNHLGTASGQAGYAWHDDRHTGHLRFNYTGLPVAFSLIVDYNDRDAAEFGRISSSSGSNSDSYISFFRFKDAPLIDGKLRGYIPLNYSSGGWLRGIVPMVELSMRNDGYERGYYRSQGIPSQWNGFSTRYVHTGDEGFDTYASLTGSVRWYSMLPVPSSRIYPKLGLGLEAGARAYILSEGYYAPTLYAYAYGYVPGFYDTHGIRLSALGQFMTKEDVAAFDNTVNCCPRGFEDTTLDLFTGHYCPVQAKFTADYALPFAPVDWSFLGPLAYIRNFELTPFADLSLLKYRSNMTSSRGISLLWSAGADLSVHLSNLLWLPYGSRIGVRYARTGANSSHASFLNVSGYRADNNYLGFIFSVDM